MNNCAAPDCNFVGAVSTGLCHYHKHWSPSTQAAITARERDREFRWAAERKEMSSQIATLERENTILRKAVHLPKLAPSRNDPRMPGGMAKREPIRHTGLSADQKDTLRWECWEDQGEVCPTCGDVLTSWDMERKSPRAMWAVLDHDHETDLVRGVLHSECNTRLGVVERLLRIGDLPRMLAFLSAGQLEVCDNWPHDSCGRTSLDAQISVPGDTTQILELAP